MSGNASIITPFVKRPASNTDSFVMLEQQPWSRNIGRVTKLDLIQALEQQFFDGSGALVDCGMGAGGSIFHAIVFAYPSSDDFLFNVGMTHGSYAGPTRVELTVREALSFSLDTEQAMTYPVKRFISALWADKVFSVAGDVLDHPPLINDGQNIVAAAKVYGTVYVEYTTVRYVYTISVPARDAAIENAFSSVFYAWWDGGIELLTVDAPESAEASYFDRVDCTGGSLDVISPDDPDYVPVADPVNREIALSYCEDFGNE